MKVDPDPSCPDENNLPTWHEMNKGPSWIMEMIPPTHVSRGRVEMHQSEV